MEVHIMDISSLGITGVAVITVICFLVGQVWIVTEFTQWNDTV